jgi:hypothetical protein
MTVTITNNMTKPSEGQCDSVTGWTSSSTDTVYTSLFRESTGCIGMGASASNEHAYFTIASTDFATRTLFGWMLNGSPGTTANVGFGLVLGDGTDIIAYAVGGSDNYGHFVNGWSGFRLDGANRPATTRVIAGAVANLNINAITQIGIAMNYSITAFGKIDNIFYDAIRYISNGSAALTIAGGSTGARGTFAEIVTDDASTADGKAHGIFRVLTTGSKAYEMTFGVEFGDSGTASTYFEDTDFQLIIVGTNMSAGNMDVDLLANGTGTNVFNLTDGVIVNVGTVSNWNLSATMDEMKLTRMSFTDMGTFTFPTQSANNRFLLDSTFNNCGQVYPSTCDMDNIIFNGTTNANGALKLDESVNNASNMSALTFNSDGTGHAIYMLPVGAGPFTYNFDNWQFTGYASSDGTTGNEVILVDNANDANITINIQNSGDVPSIRKAAGYTGTVTINNAVTVKVSGVTEGAAITVIADETVGTLTAGDVILSGRADSTGKVQTTSFNYEAAFNPTGVDVIVTARSQGIAISARQSDNGVFTDFTTAAMNSTSADVTFFPASEVANQDSFYIGHTEQFGAMKLDISTAATGTYTIAYQYWNGSTWASLTGVTDNTSSLSVTGENKVSWTIPGNWATSTQDGAGPYYYIRIMLTSGSFTVNPIGSNISLDVTRYLPQSVSRTITSTGLDTIIPWVEDTIAQF